MKTGLELIFTLQLAVEIMDEYNLKGLEKRHANMLRKTLEKNLESSYDKAFDLNPTIAINAMNLKQRMISQIATLKEAEAIAFSEYVNNFFEDKKKITKDIKITIKQID